MATSGSITIIETYNVHCCQTCGVSYALTSAFESRRRDDHKTFYCPNGHTQYYPQKNDVEKQRERAERLERQLANRDEDLRAAHAAQTAATKKLAAARGQLTKTKKRLANGVCPCCNRTFANLGRHMSGQHPDYAEASTK
jgi:C4-dicarboxylate-specific signal transduction histidine kinase